MSSGMDRWAARQRPCLGLGVFGALAVECPRGRYPEPWLEPVGLFMSPQGHMYIVTPAIRLGPWVCLVL